MLLSRLTIFHLEVVEEVLWHLSISVNRLLSSLGISSRATYMKLVRNLTRRLDLRIRFDPA